LIATGEKIDGSLQLVLYLVHKLEYYGEFSIDYKVKINLKKDEIERIIEEENILLFKLVGDD
jgi:hypothetical protein